MDHLKAVKTGTIDSKMQGTRLVDRRLTIKSNSDRPCGDGMSATQNVEEAEGAKDSGKFALM